MGERNSSGQYIGKPLSAYLILGDRHLSHHSLKKRLVREGLLEFRCAWCKITEWRGLPAPLQLDHINGNPRDNRIENLRFLCPNCHAQTETFCRGSHGQRVEAKTNCCADCGNPCGKRAKWCKPCGYKHRSVRNQYTN